MTAREVELTGGAPWGFRMHGGADQNQPLRISRRYSDTLERTLDVNPGRKASISGMREGDVISSINGRATKGMSNADAHAMLRSAGPVLRLGLNEDREMSPRRRSIGKGSELKRPSQLVAEVQGCRATPQAPVYATTATVQSLQRQPPPSPYKSLNSVPAALNSTQLVKSVVQNEEPVRFHPTNPFYTTLPSSYSSGSKLPVPSGRSTVSSLDRSKNKYNDHKSPAMFTNIPDSGPSSLPYSCNNETESINGYDSYKKTCPPSGGKYSHLFETSNMDQFQNQHQINSSERARNTKNPFDPKRNSDPFEKYLRPDSKLNGDCKYENKSMSNSISDSNFHSNEEITKRSTITEHKISEIQEVKTVKKIVLNGCDDKIDRINEHSVKFELPSTNGKSNEVNGPQQNFANTKETGLSSYQSPRSEHGLSTPVHERNDYSLQFNQDERQCNSTSAYDSTYKENRSAETQADKVVSKPPVNSPGTPTNDHSPGPKREYYIDFT